MLEYLKDRPSVFQSPPAAWLVAPLSGAFATAAAEETELWADSQSVSRKLSTRFGYAAQ